MLMVSEKDDVAKPSGCFGWSSAFPILTSMESLH